MLLAAVPAFGRRTRRVRGCSEGRCRPGTNVDLEFLMAPLTGANGKLLGYAYINPRLTVVSEGFVTPVREKAALHPGRLHPRHQRQGRRHRR